MQNLKKLLNLFRRKKDIRPILDGPKGENKVCPIGELPRYWPVPPKGCVFAVHKEYGNAALIYAVNQKTGQVFLFLGEWLLTHPEYACEFRPLPACSEI